MDAEMKGALEAGITAVRGLHKLQDQMFSAVEEVTLILLDGQVQLKALELAEAVDKRKRYEELGHKGRSWRGR